MSDLTQEIERGVGEFASGDNDPNDPNNNNNNNNSQQQGGDELQRQDNNYNDNNTTSEMRNDTRASTQQTETGGNNTGAGAMESTADNYINQGTHAITVYRTLYCVVSLSLLLFLEWLWGVN